MLSLLTRLNASHVNLDQPLNTILIIHMHASFHQIFISHTILMAKPPQSTSTHHFALSRSEISQIHLVVLISVHTDLLTLRSSAHTVQVSLPYSIALLTQATYSFLLVLVRVPSLLIEAAVN